MDIFGALVLFVVLFVVIPVAVCAAAMVLMGGAEQMLPGGTRARSARPPAESEHH